MVTETKVFSLNLSGSHRSTEEVIVIADNLLEALQKLDNLRGASATESVVSANRVYGAVLE